MFGKMAKRFSKYSRVGDVKLAGGKKARFMGNGVINVQNRWKIVRVQYISCDLNFIEKVSTGY